MSVRYGGIASGSRPNSVVGGPNGMTENTTSDGTMMRTGPERYTSFSTRDGTMSSLAKSLRASAIGCSTPNHPTRLGPSRICRNPTRRRSKYDM